MSTQNLHISNEADAWTYLNQALKGKYDDKVIAIDFSTWPNFHINIKGDRYNSTITTALMKSLIELQININNIYGEIVYGRDSRSLTDAEREAIQLVFKVENGSSDILADLAGFFSELGRKAGEKMSGKQIVLTVLGAAAIIASSVAYDNYLETSQKSAEDKQKHDITMALIKQQPELLKFREDQIAAISNVIKSANDAESINVGGTKFSKKDIAEISFQDKKTSEYKRLDGKYLISSLKITPSLYKIDVTSVATGETIKTQVEKGFLSIDEMTKITKSFTSEQPIHLNIAARFNGETFTRAIILGVNNKANGSKVDSIAKR